MISTPRGHAHHLVCAGQIITGDYGFASQDSEVCITDDLSAQLVRPDRNNEPQRFGKLGGIWQWIESIFDTLKGATGLGKRGTQQAIPYQLRSLKRGLKQLGFNHLVRRWLLVRIRLVISQIVILEAFLDGLEFVQST